MAILAVDPSSRRSGGSLLGDRARIEFDPADRGVLIRSTAAGERLGGLAWATRSAADALAAAFDVVVIETVGVGQAETDVADVADTVVVVVQPGSGDVLQFLKSGIMEIPDVLVVTKADLGQIALRARRDVSAALRSLGSSSASVLAVSALPPPSGVEELAAALERASRRAGPRRASLGRAPRRGPDGVRGRARRARRARRSAAAARRRRCWASRTRAWSVPALVAALERRARMRRNLLMHVRGVRARQRARGRARRGQPRHGARVRADGVRGHHRVRDAQALSLICSGRVGTGCFISTGRSLRAARSSG